MNVKAWLILKLYKYSTPKVMKLSAAESRVSFRVKGPIIREEKDLLHSFMVTNCTQIRIA
jgi:hypothetical protein